MIPFMIFTVCAVVSRAEHPPSKLQKRDNAIIRFNIGPPQKQCKKRTQK
jgi:hypothetical protein